MAACGAMLVSGVLVGCAPSDPDLAPVSGRIVGPGGETGSLAGHIVETVPETAAGLRASGEIRADGSFHLETLKDGEIKTGALRGRHRVRLVLSDDDVNQRKATLAAIDKRYLSFEKSGWTIEVPEDGSPTGPVELTTTLR